MAGRKASGPAVLTEFVGGALRWVADQVLNRGLPALLMLAVADWSARRSHPAATTDTAPGDQNRDFTADQIGSQCGELLVVPFRPAILDCNILSVDESHVP